MSVLVRFFANHVFLENKEFILGSHTQKENSYASTISYGYFHTSNNKKYLIETSFRTSFLKDRFTQSGLSFPWKPRTFGDNVLILHYLSLLMLALSSLVHHIFSQKYFKYFQTVPLPSNSMNSQLRCKLLSPYIFSE